MFTILSCVFLLIIAAGFFYYKNFYSRQENEEEVELDSNSTKNISKTIKVKYSAAVKTPLSKAVKSYSKAKVVAATNKKDHKLHFDEVGGHKEDITCFTFSNKGDLIATASSDGYIRAICVTDIGQAIQHDTHYMISGSVPNTLVFTQNSKRLIAATPTKIYFFKFPTLPDDKKFELVKEFNTNLSQSHTVQVMDVEKWMTIAVAGEDQHSKPTVKLFNQKGDTITTLGQLEKSNKDRKTNRRPAAKIALLATSPDDRFMAISGVGESVGILDGEVGIFEIVRNKDGESEGIILRFSFAGHDSDVTAIAWSSNGKQAVTCCADGTWRFWDASGKFNDFEKPKLYSGSYPTPNKSAVQCVSLVNSSHGLLVCMVVSKSFYYFTAGSGEEKEVVEDAIGGQAVSLRSSADGLLVGVVVEGAKRISLWRSP